MFELNFYQKNQGTEFPKKKIDLTAWKINFSHFPPLQGKAEKKEWRRMGLSVFQREEKNKNN